MTDFNKHAFTTFAKLIGTEFVEGLPSDYKDLKKFLPKINVYGTIDNPLFIAKEVQEALNRKELFRPREFSNEILTHYIKETIRFRGQNREVLFLTEHGLHQTLSLKRGKTGEQFRCFVSLALKNLYKYKETSLKDTVESARFHQDEKEFISLTYMKEVTKLKRIVEEQAKDIYRLNVLNDESQINFNEVTDENDKLDKQVTQLNHANVLQHYNIDQLTSKVRKIRSEYDLYNPSNAVKLDKFHEMFFSKIEVHLLPDDICDTAKVSLNLTYSPAEYNEVDIDETGLMLYTMVKKVEHRGMPTQNTRPIDRLDSDIVYTGYVPKPIDRHLKQVKQYIQTIINPKTYVYKKFTIYETSLEFIKSAFDIVEAMYLGQVKWSKEWPNIRRLNGKA